MIKKQLHITQIYNQTVKFFCVISLILLLCNSSEALEFGEIRYNNTNIDYTKIDKASTLQKADLYFRKAEQTQDVQEKRTFLQKAAGEYFILTQIDRKSLYPIVQLARVYDYSEKNRYSRAYFYQALRIEQNNPATNYYFGEYYFKRDDYVKAIHYYNIAFDNGYKENYDVLLKMALMYEKLGDLIRANQYYKKAYLINQKDDTIPEKIRYLESIRYQTTGYYNKQRRK